MTNQRFCILFRGELRAGYDIETVKNNLQKLAGLDVASIERLFAVSEAVIKSNVDEVMVERYMTALKRAGILCYVVPLDKLDGKVQTGNRNSASVIQQTVCPKCGTRQSAGTNCISCGVIYEKYYMKCSMRAASPKTLRRTSRLPLFIVLFFLIAGVGTIWWFYHHKDSQEIDETQGRPMRKQVGQLMGGSIQGEPLNLSGSVSLFAGSPGVFGSADGLGASARFANIVGVTTDGTYLYVADYQNETIRKIDISTGTVSTLAGKANESGSDDGVGGSARLHLPRAITTDGVYLYVPQGDTIRKIDGLTGKVTTMAVGFSAEYITTDGRYLYVAGGYETTGYVLGKIDISTGIYTKIPIKFDSKSSQIAFVEDRPEVNGLTTDGTYLYFTDGNAIEKVEILTGITTNLMGLDSGFNNFLNYHFGPAITTDGKYLYVNAKNKSDKDETILQVDITTGEISTYGIGTSERFQLPRAMTTDGESLYILQSNNCIKKISASLHREKK